jgi:uncharacterized Zn-binding protein involved in type VI secretion
MGWVANPPPDQSKLRSQEMNGRRAVIGLSLLSALVLCAFAAPSAMAVKGTTAFTCAQSAPTIEFEDEHCTKKGQFGSDKWGHETFVGSTQASVTNNITGGQHSFLRFKFELAGVKAELEATKFLSGTGTTVLNKENGAKQMEATGGNDGEFTEITVIKPAKCTLKSVNLEKGTGQTKVVQNAAKEEEMWIEFTTSGGVFVKFAMEGPECALKEKTIEVKGTAKANVLTSQTQLDGPTLQFTIAQTEKTLQVGGKPATFEGTFTVRNKASNNPIVLTTQTT